MKRKNTINLEISGLGTCDQEDFKQMKMHGFTCSLGNCYVSGLLSFPQPGSTPVDSRLGTLCNTATGPIVEVHTVNAWEEGERTSTGSKGSWTV